MYGRAAAGGVLGRGTVVRINPVGRTGDFGDCDGARVRGSYVPKR